MADTIRGNRLQAKLMEHVKELDAEMKTAIRAARAAGVDASDLAPYEGKQPTTPRRTRSHTSAPRASTRAPRARSANGPILTEEKVLEAMRANPGATQKRLSVILKVSDATLQRRMSKLKDDNRISKEGSGGQTKWFVTSLPEPAGIA